MSEKIGYFASFSSSENMNRTRRKCSILGFRNAEKEIWRVIIAFLVRENVLITASVDVLFNKKNHTL
jgi:hypothetical protein